MELRDQNGGETKWSYLRCLLKDIIGRTSQSVSPALGCVLQTSVSERSESLPRLSHCLCHMQLTVIPNSGALFIPALAQLLVQCSSVK